MEISNGKTGQYMYCAHLLVDCLKAVIVWGHIPPIWFTCLSSATSTRSKIREEHYQTSARDQRRNVTEYTLGVDGLLLSHWKTATVSVLTLCLWWRNIRNILLLVNTSKTLFSGCRSSLHWSIHSFSYYRWFKKYNELIKQLKSSVRSNEWKSFLLISS